MFGVTGIPIRHEFGLNGLEFGSLTATPVLTCAPVQPAARHMDRQIGRADRDILIIRT